MPVRKKIGAPSGIRESQSVPAVLGRRPDGYHELRTIFQTISLHDTLSFPLTPGSRDYSLKRTIAALPIGPGQSRVSRDRGNRREIGFRGGIRAHLEKRIPVARGLGGGSSDAAAALIGMLRLTKKTVPLARLMEIAAGLGADVPFFLFGGRALAVNRGDEIYPLADVPKRTIVVVSPQGYRREHEGRLRMGLSGIDKTAETP